MGPCIPGIKNIVRKAKVRCEKGCALLGKKNTTPSKGEGRVRVVINLLFDILKYLDL